MYENVGHPWQIVKKNLVLMDFDIKTVLSDGTVSQVLKEKYNRAFAKNWEQFRRICEAIFVHQ